MPYSHRRAAGGGWDIVKTTTGEKVGHSDTETNAKASIRARYAAEAGKMREGSYTLPDGRKVQFTDADTFQLATDLYQYIEHDYKGSDSVDAVRLEDIIKNLQAGRPLESTEWDILADMQKRLGAEFTRWRESGRDGQGAAVPAGSGRIQEALATLPPSLRARIRESGGYKTDSTTAKDRQTTPPHLLDGALHDLAHAKQHADRLTDPDVKKNPKSVEFNHEHMMKHLTSGIDHLSRMGKHLEQHGADPKVFQQERETLHKLRESSASPPPNLREAPTESTSETGPDHECATCRMFDGGRCWGYGNVRVSGNWLCDSWEVDPHWPEQHDDAVNAGLLRESRSLDLVKVAAIRSMEEASKSTIAVDFDGVVHQGPHGLPGKVEGTIIPGAEQGLKKLAQNHQVVLMTARTDLDAVRVWLKDQGVLKYFVDVTNIKPPAAAYIDDRAVHFDGWPVALEATNPQVAVTQTIKTTKVPDAGPN